jgi:uncharacterized protein YdcH (DUF465 family)
MNMERLKRKHEHLHSEVAELEAIREVDRTAETKAQLIELKKEKLKLKDEIARIEDEPKY